jgi:diguanylate cyclase (GGDEF)-like protein
MPSPALDITEIDRLNLQGLSCLIANRKQARRLTRIAHNAASKAGYLRGVAHAAINRLWQHYYDDEADQAEPHWPQLRQQFHDSGDLEGVMAADVAMGALASRRGDFPLAERHFELALDLANQIPDSLHKFMLFNRLGIDALNRGDTSAGPRNFLLALDIAERYGTAAHRVNSLSNLASSVHDLGNDEDAIPLLGEALAIVGHDKLHHQRPIVSANLAMCLLATGKADEALELVEPFYDNEDVDSVVRAFLFCIAAHASILVGRMDQVPGLLKHAWASAGEDLEEQMHAWLVQGMYDYVSGRPAAALEALEQARALLSWTRNPFYQQQIFEGLANINARLKRWKAAYEYHQLFHSHFEASSRSARDSRLLMRSLEKEMRSLKEERDKALELQAAREYENQQLEHLNRELSHQILHVSMLQDKLKEQAIRDYLTGLYNRRHFETCLNAILHESNGKFPVAVVILDLDFFKKINDTYGHGFGDEVLVQFARLVEGQLRGSDMVCRYGGEEFCLLMRDADAATAVSKMEVIARRFAELCISCDPHRMEGCTFSAGVAEYPRHGGSRHELLMRADTALYAAKMAGRNRVHIAV